MSHPHVVIVGAGPTGLTLACELAWRGVSVRIVDRADGPADESRALGVHARTLELLAPHVTTEMLQRGHRIAAFNLHDGAQRLARIETAGIDSAHAYVLSLPQSETERLLAGRLRRLGVDVEWRTEAVALEQLANGVRLTLRRATQEDEIVEVPWVVGCDGAGSFVREAAGLPFEGERYPTAFRLADLALELSDASREAHGFLAADGILGLIPLPEPGRYRMVASESRGSAAEDHPDPTLADLERLLRQRAGPEVSDRVMLGEPTWTSRFRIHRRIVPTLRSGRVLLAGDAAHVHSPVGGQGMNSGIYDAVNLGWKLALVTTGRADPRLLDSYDAERHPEARAILRGTHWLTRFATIEHPIAHGLRVAFVRALFGRGFFAWRFVRQLAGTEVHYRASPIVSDQARLIDRLRHRGAPQPGDRAPDAPTASGRLYDAFDHPGHTLLLFREAGAIEAAIRQHSRVEIRTVVVTDAAVRARYHADAFPLYVIRPDRYIGFRDRRLAAEPVLQHLEAVCRGTEAEASSVIDVIP